MTTSRRVPVSGELLAWLDGLTSGFYQDGPVDDRFTRLGLDASDDERDGLVLGRGPLVVKLHARYTDPAALRARLAAVQGSDLASCWVQPLSSTLATAPDGRLASMWPRVEPLVPDDPVPWADAGRLLATLHNAPVGAGGPRHGGRARLQRASASLRSLGRGDLDWLADFGERLGDELSGERATAWIHGDFHLGQLARGHHGAGWRLLDVDDLGLGDPAWDLARPAGFWAAGLLDDSAWSDFLAAYRAADGPGVPPTGDPWPVLDLPARAAVVVATIRALRRAPGDFTAESLLATCRRMAGFGA